MAKVFFQNLKIKNMILNALGGQAPDSEALIESPLLPVNGYNSNYFRTRCTNT
jgi:hypothetical protein